MDLDDIGFESPWGYAIVAAIVALDGFFPIVPGETAVITGGIAAADGALSTPLVAIAAMAGVLVGDNVSYLLGATLGARTRDRLFRGARARRRLEWAARQLEERGQVIIVVARFIPGGRTAATFAAGGLRLDWRCFIAADLVAAGVWSLYSTLLGRLGGEAFRESFWAALAAALAAAALLAAAGELYRRRRAARRPSAPAPGAAGTLAAARGACRVGRPAAGLR